MSSMMQQAKDFNLIDYIIGFDLSGWSLAKKMWCCKEKGLGCGQT
jgi:hypothetical protein